MTSSQDVTSGTLADRLEATAVEALAALGHHLGRNLRLPDVYAGRPVPDRDRISLASVLGLLFEAGIEEVGPARVGNAIRRLLVAVDLRAADEVTALRLGETLRHAGDVVPPPVTAGVVRLVRARWSAAAPVPPTGNALRAVRRARFGLLLAGIDGDRPEGLGDAIRTVEKLLSESTTGWLPDGGTGPVAHGRLTPESYLSSSAFGGDVGPVWRSGFDRVWGDLDLLAQRGGTVTWGDRVGWRAQVLTVEAAGLAVGEGIGAAEGRWIRRAAEALDEICSWLRNGVLDRRRGAPVPFQSPWARIAATLALHGRLLTAATELRRRPDVRACAASQAWPDVDSVVWFQPGTSAAWSYRSDGISFVLPVTGTGMPSPRSPGLFETPTGGQPVFVPVVRSADTPGRLYAGPPGPFTLTHERRALTIVREGWASVEPGDATTAPLAGKRTVTYRVEGNRLAVTERLVTPFASPAVTISVPESRRRRLEVAVRDGGAARRIDTAQVPEWSGTWDETNAVHQLEPVGGGPEMRFEWTVSPQLRIGATGFGHPYSRLLYRPLRRRVSVEQAPPPDDDLLRRLRDVDILHLAWPEHWVGIDPALTRRAIAAARAAGTRIVWTQHNLVPHRAGQDGAEAYALWAAAADAVIHHSSYGLSRARTTYQYGPDTIHRVIAHGHWADHYGALRSVTRRDVERDEGWSPCAIRLAVIGSPRAGKSTDLVIDAVTRCERHDIQLLVRVPPGTRVPDDPRIIPQRSRLGIERIHRRVVATDAIIFPYVPNNLLMTGTIFDSIGAGTAAITSDWALFDELLDGADIRYGSTAEDLARCIDALTPARLARSRTAMLELQQNYEWRDSAAATLKLYQDVMGLPARPRPRPRRRRRVRS